MNFLTVRKMLRALRSFVTIPGLIGLTGILLAVAAHLADLALNAQGPVALPDWFSVSMDTAETVLTVTAGAAISALVMVYSIVLLIYTMAASSIGPRLLQRFRDDRSNQVSVGTLSSTFLYCLTALWLIEPDGQAAVSAAVALVLAVLSVLLLLYFVNTVSRRVTIDQEAAEIATALDDQIRSALAVSSTVSSDRIVLPEGPEHWVEAGRAGYIDTIAGSLLAGRMAQVGGIAVFSVRPGDFVLEGQKIARVIGPEDDGSTSAVQAAAPVIDARDPVGDLRFSVNLLVEIALRALSPGVNDTFTAIGCVDRLSSSLTRAWRDGLSVGVFADKAGGYRVVYPTIEPELLFEDAMTPLRRAARGNGLMTQAMGRVLSRIAKAVPPEAREQIIGEMERLRADIDACGLPQHDCEALTMLLDKELDSMKA